VEVTEQYDLVVIGGGTAGLVAAHGAAGMGASVVMVEPHHPGGDCLWYGCVPSKRLLSAAHAAHVMRTADRHGIKAVEPEIDFAEVMAQVKHAQEHIAHHDSVERLEKAGVRVIPALGSFVGPGQIQAGDEVINYRKAMIATGASPLVPGIPGLRESEPLTSDTIWDMTELPKRLVVIGGGAIGCELGQAFNRLGSEVTLIEGAPRILNNLGENVSALIAERFRGEGMTVIEDEFVTGVEGSASTGDLVVKVGDTSVPCDQILVAVGRRPNTANLNLEAVGVELTDRGHIKVDDKLESTNDHIYAGGDVVGKMPFTHTAGYHAGLVISNALFGLRRKADHDKIPFAIFCDPEVASVGRVTSDDDEELTVSHFDYQQLDRQVTTGEPVGFVDLFTDGKGKLVGATVVGETAGETINEMAARIHAGDKLRAIGQMVRPYPTFAEGPAKAANEVLREQFFTPRTKKLVRPVLSVLKKFDKP
jgi:pyruvate/2-oxoglutarate dehydrogenase complex dihydrolipoamide dehydrogenase (E3) component